MGKTFTAPPGSHYSVSADLIERAESNTITRLDNTTAYTAGDIINDGVTTSGTLTDPFDTTDESTTVVVNDTDHGLVVGRTVNFSSGDAVGGITLSGDYTVTAVTSSDIYEIEHSAPATSTVSAGGGSVNFTYIVEPASDFELTVPNKGVIERVEVKASALLTHATMRVWLFNAAPATIAGDNLAFAASLDTLIGQAELECDQVGSDMTIGFGAAAIPYVLSGDGTTIYALLQTVDGYTPTAEETFDIALLVAPRA